jgi:proline iminopeptidase
VGNNPTIKVLLLHGGPGLTHELYECFDGYFPNESIEYIYYDQLGSYSVTSQMIIAYGQPNVSSKKWNKSTLGADSSNFLCFRTILGRNTSYGICLKISK